MKLHLQGKLLGKNVKKHITSVQNHYICKLFEKLDLLYPNDEIRCANKPCYQETHQNYYDLIKLFWLCDVMN